MNQFTPHILFFLVGFNISLSVSAQQPNTTKFIEPNISLSYDSNYFKLTRQYGNTYYEIESCSFSYLKDTDNNRSIIVKAGFPTGIQARQVDSIMRGSLREMKIQTNDSFSIISIDTAVRHINGFSFLGFVGYDRFGGKYAAFINGIHVSGDDLTTVSYAVENGKDLEKEYVVLSQLLQGFKTFSMNQIHREDSLIKAKYKVDVKPALFMDDVKARFKYQKKTFIGIVTVVPLPENKLMEVRLNTSGGQEIFEPNEKGVVAIICNDKETGKLEKKGELVLLNSFGKRVKVPFTFTYINNGPIQ
jgi:hypothetical protein